MSTGDKETLNSASPSPCPDLRSFNRRELLAAGLRDPVRTVDGLLPDPDLHTLGADCHNIVGELLAKPKRDPRSGGPRSNHCAHYDDPNVLDQRGATKDLLRQVYRRLSGHLLRHGLCLVAR